MLRALNEPLLVGLIVVVPNVCTPAPNAPLAALAP